MFSFFRKPEQAKQASALHETIRAHYPAGDEDAVHLVAAVAGLLVQVAYEDRPYLPAEEARIRAALEKVHGLTPAGVDAVCATLRQHVAHIALVEAREYARWVADHTDHAFRLELLDLILDVAAADQRISVVETNLMRRVAGVLGLSSVEYNAAQERHRDKLGALNALK